MTTKRAVIYTRVSSDRQEVDGSSLDTQLSACHSYATDKGYSVIGKFTDTWTGAQWRERPGLNQLRGVLRSGGVDVVVCYALDRLSRNQAHLYILAEEIEDNGARLQFVTEDFEDSAVGRFIRSAKAFAAEVEREKIAERSNRGRKARVESGSLMPGPRALYGYRWADEGKTRLELNPETAAIVARMYRELVDGGTLRSISAGLTSAGVPTPTGKTTGWSYSTIRAILRNRAYKGEAYGWGYSHAKSGNTFNPETAIPLPEGTIPPIVNPVTWEAANHVLDRNRQRSVRNTKNPEVALLRGGFARCGYCGATLVVRTRTGKNRGYDYICGRAYGYKSCVTHCISVKILDREVWDRVQAIMLDDDALRQGFEGQVSAGVDELALVTKAQARVTKQRDNLVRAIALTDDEETAAGMVAQLEGLTTQRRELEAERETLGKLGERQELARQTLRDFEQWRRRIAATMDVMTWAERRQLLDQLGIHVNLWKHDHAPRWHITSEIVPGTLFKTS